MFDFSSPGFLRQLKKQQKELRSEQQVLARQERAQTKELHATRNRLDEIAYKLDATAVLKIELERMRLSPQTPPVAHSGWSREELETLRTVYAISTADRCLAARELVGRAIDADVPSTEEMIRRAADEDRHLNPNVATPARIVRAMAKRRQMEK